MAITSISPIDGRYASKVTEFESCFSEYALIYNRIKVEVIWLIALCDEAGIPECRTLTADEKTLLLDIVKNLTPEEAQRVKEIERTTNHDVKAVEYFLK
jgi:adenylosuccinate lyase